MGVSRCPYITGTSRSVRNVANVRPQITEIAIGPHKAACSPPQYTSGRRLA